MSSLNSIWENVLENISENIPTVSFQTWFKDTKLIDLNSSSAVVKADNEFQKGWLSEKYLTLIETSIYSAIGENVSVKIVFEGEQLDETHAAEEKSAEKSDNVQMNIPVKHALNEQHTFDTFVIGNGNRFSHAASLAVAEAPAKAYNPLFIYGGVGLGKTHLMHAIGNYVLEHRPNAKVVYLSSEKFTNEFINSIRDNKTEQFRNKYRNVDVLLIDDIQFLAGKESTQEEFFHTFNSLHENGKQIVISSDRTPKEIPTLEDRLRSRFEWGLMTDVTPPDLETRIAILRKKCEEENVEIPNEAMIYIATHNHTNIRELEGALTRVAA